MTGRTTILLFMLTLFAAGCGARAQITEHRQDLAGRRVAVEGPEDARLDDLEIRFSYAPTDTASLVVAFAVPSVAGSAASEIRSFTARLVDEDGGLRRRTTTSDINSSGTMSSSGAASIMVYGSVTLTEIDDLPAGTRLLVQLETPRGAIERELPLGPNSATEEESREPRSSMHLRLETRETGTGLDLTLHAERLAPPPDGEYLPSGEQFRIEISDDQGNEVWSSSAGRAFIQSIGTVEPNEVGEEMVFRTHWNGERSIGGGRVPAGTYRVRATIPARPVPYILFEELTYRGR